MVFMVAYKNIVKSVTENACSAPYDCGSKGLNTNKPMRETSTDRRQGTVQVCEV